MVLQVGASWCELWTTLFSNEHFPNTPIRSLDREVFQRYGFYNEHIVRCGAHSAKRPHHYDWPEFRNSRTIFRGWYMNFDVVYVSRGSIQLKNDDKHVRVLGEALITSTPTEPSYVIYLNSLNNWEIPPGVALTETEKQDVISAIRKHFQSRGLVVEFE